MIQQTGTETGRTKANRTGKDDRNGGGRKPAFTDAKVKQMVRAYERGATLAAIAEKVGSTASTVHRYLDGHVEFRPRGRRPAAG